MPLFCPVFFFFRSRRWDGKLVIACGYLGVHYPSQTAVHQLGSRALVSMWGLIRHHWFLEVHHSVPVTLGKAQPAQFAVSACHDPAFHSCWLPATSILSDAECSEGIRTQCWPGLGLLSTSLDKLHAPDAPDRTPGVAPEWAVSAGQLCPSPGCHRNWWGCVWVNSSPLPEVSSRCSRGAVHCSWQKAGVGPTSWTQGGRKP